MASDKDNEDSLLKSGQTVEAWWRENGLDTDAAQAARALRYAEQRAATLAQCRCVAAARMVDVG